ncbi:uncharacterized protein BP01DRAFT_308960, partial [Aspergillus saccharolyticus JOP 1030-1]
FLYIYINNFILFSIEFKQYLVYLEKFFSKYKEIYIILSSNKLFLAFLSIKILG